MFHSRPFQILTGNVQGSYIWRQFPATLTPANLITVTITGPQRKLRKPGDTDPAVLGPLITKMWEEFHAQEAMEQVLHYDVTEENLRNRQKEMTRGGSLTWWDSESSPARDEMRYECDTGLGAPGLVDCTKIQWQGLGPPSDTLTVGPGSAKFFTSSKCLPALISLKGSNIILQSKLT